MSNRGNLGDTTIRLRGRRVDPMRAYDALPPELRAWMAEAALPWSPTSCLKLWRKAMEKQGCPKKALERMAQAEAAMLARDQRPNAPQPPRQRATSTGTRP